MHLELDDHLPRSRRLRLVRAIARSPFFFLALAAAALLYLRLPNLYVPILNVDEADFVIEAGSLLDGGRPYVDFVEKKPPLIYFLFAAGMKLCGRYDLPGLRVLLFPYLLATAWFVARFIA